MRFSFAMILAATAAAGCGGPGPKGPPDTRDPEMLNAASSGQQAFARGSVDQAIDQFRRSLRRARLQGDPPMIADQAYNLAVALLSEGRFADAAAALDEAEVAAGSTNLPMADILLVRARLAYATASSSKPDTLEATDAAAIRVLDDPASKPADVHRVAVAVLRTEVACDRGNASAAAEQLRVARSIAAANPSAGGAGLFRAAGRVAALSRDHPAAAAAFDEESRLHRQAHRYAEMARALSDAGRAYQQSANPAAAADRYHRSAASWAAQDRFAEAARTVEAARIAAAKAGDRARLRLIAVLAREIEQAGGLATPATRGVVREEEGRSGGR